MTALIPIAEYCQALPDHWRYDPWEQKLSPSGEVCQRELFHPDLPPLLIACSRLAPPAAWADVKPGHGWYLFRRQVNGFHCDQEEALVHELPWADGVSRRAVFALIENEGYEDEADNQAIGRTPTLLERYRTHLALLGVTCDQPENASGTVQAWYRLDLTHANLRQLTGIDREPSDILGCAPEDAGAYLLIAGENCD